MIRAAHTGTVWVSKLRRRDAQSRSEPRGNPGEFLENSNVNAAQILMAVSPPIHTGSTVLTTQRFHDLIPFYELSNQE